ncbi:hypothetical protein VTN02DRAFT_5660 [Thermoascus thermophilus]
MWDHPRGLSGSEPIRDGAMKRETVYPFCLLHHHPLLVPIDLALESPDCFVQAFVSYADVSCENGGHMDGSALRSPARDSSHASHASHAFAGATWPVTFFLLSRWERRGRLAFLGHSLDFSGIDSWMLSFTLSSSLSRHVYQWDMLSFSLILHSSTSM